MIRSAIAPPDPAALTLFATAHGDGEATTTPREGTICTNPNHGVRELKVGCA